MIEWGSPQNFIWLWSLPVILVVFRLASARKKAQIKRFGDPELVEKLILSFDGRKRLAKRVLVLLAAAAIVLALCQPHFRTKEIEVERKGVNVIIAVDVSRSMLAKDVAPNRLEKAKLELSTLIDRLKQDRIGIVAFAGEAFIQCPLTLDKNAVKIFLTTINPDLIPTPGTAVGAAIRVAVQAFDDKDKDNKAVILLTDGEDHESDPLGAAKKAKAAGIRVFTIGLGTQDGSTVPGASASEGFKKDRDGKVVLSKLDETLLKRIAQETGGSYYRSTRGELEIDRLVGEIRTLAQKGFSKDKIIEYDENYQYFLVISLILLCLEMLLSERRRPSSGPGGQPQATAAVLLVAFAWPFLCGFQFYSALKNEEGNRQMKKGLVGKAKQAYASAQKSEPKAPEVAFNLGNAYYKEDAFDRSLKSYADAARLPSTPELGSKTYYNLGNSLFRQKQNDKAIEAYKEALRKNPKDEDAKYNLQLLLKKQDQNKQDDKKQDQQKDQKQDQKDQKDQKDQGGGGGQGQENKDKQEQQGSGGQSDKDKGEQQDQPQGSEGQDKKEQDQQDKGQEQNKDSGSEQKDAGQPKEPGDEKKEQGSQGQGGEDEPQPAEPKEEKGDQGGEGQEAEQGEPKEAQPKTAAEIRADQILDALNDQEKKTFKLEANQKGPLQRAKKYVEKDW